MGRRVYSFRAISASLNFCTLPLAVMGTDSTNSQYFGILCRAILPWQKPVFQLRRFRVSLFVPR